MVAGGHNRLGHIKAEELRFKASICTKTLYNYIDKGIFARISNENLWIKKDGKKRDYEKNPDIGAKSLFRYLPFCVFSA
jgi:DNA topoisomerase IB